MAAPHGSHVEEPRDLESLRAHMKEMHGFDAAHMLPERVLMHVHEKDHAEGGTDWDGSPDSSRAPGFIARRR